MNKRILTLVAGALALGSAYAQNYDDASEYFTGNAYGWATVSDEAGTPYQMDGGMRAARPKTITLFASGGSDDMAIISAVANYDIIVLDGSKGDFTIEAQMGINNAKNKTIVGRNNARLCTKFYLTPEDIQYLQSQNLDGLSSTDQYTGTLPDGTTITCDKRAFFTKKAMMELQYQKTGQYTLPNRAGVIQLSASDENIIIRNITFVGPGAVDIDGVDLITNLESNHVWVDHCTFIDGQDGCLDSKRCDYASYTWNKFYYTERTYSHPYTNGCGWVSNASMTLHLTFANNEWGARCGRRLPQCDDSYIHLFNNYHNCPGNSAGMTINARTRALVENNNAAAGVKEPLTGSGADRKVDARGNSFSYSSNATVTVPYEYSLVSHIYVPMLAHAAHGAGATLDYFMPGSETTLSADNFGFYDTQISGLKGYTLMLPIKNLLGASLTLTSSDETVATVAADNATLNLKAEGTTVVTATANDALYGEFSAQITVTVTAPNEYQSFKLWDFKRSAETTAAMDASDNWSASGDVYTLSDALQRQPLLVDDAPYAEAEGLLFSTTADQLVSYKDRLRFQKGDVCAIIIPDLKKDDKVELKWKSANSSSQRGFNFSNLSVPQLLTDGTIVTKGGVVLADGDVVCTATGGIYVYHVEVFRQGGSGSAIETLDAASSVRESQAYTLSGQSVSASAKGLLIVNGKKVLNY